MSGLEGLELERDCLLERLEYMEVELRDDPSFKEKRWVRKLTEAYCNLVELQCNDRVRAALDNNNCCIDEALNSVGDVLDSMCGELWKG